MGALGLEMSQRRAMERPFFWVPRKLCKAQDESRLEVVVGNRHRALPWWDDKEACHGWTMYVLLPGFQVHKTTMIKRVVYNLDASFNQDTYTVDSPNFELTCVDPATCKVTCTIHWSTALGLQPTTLVHKLIFDELGGRTSTTISVSRRRLQFFA